MASSSPNAAKAAETTTAAPTSDLAMELQNISAYYTKSARIALSARADKGLRTAECGGQGTGDHSTVTGTPPTFLMVAVPWPMPLMTTPATFTDVAFSLPPLTE